MLIKRNLQPILEKWLFKGKILIIYGARQVGKTTLAKEILKEYTNGDGYFDCEIVSVKRALEQQDPVALKNFLGNHKIIVLDEAQKVLNIGLSLKLLIDTYPDMQIIATGSSSFDLANKINEPLTGRALEFPLFPLSLNELSQVYHKHELDSQLPFFMVFGMYPGIVNVGQSGARSLLDNLSGQYLYKDVLEFENLKRSTLLLNLLQLLAMQIGNEVSINELSVTLRCGRDTVWRYLDLLEKSFVIFRLRAFSRNLRKEIGKKQKIYFYDLGIRNSLINQYNALDLRNDVGALWENFCVVERMKHLQNIGRSAGLYFWRTHDQKEVDYLEEYNGKLEGLEFKWNAGKFNPPKDFLTYPDSTVMLVNRRNYQEFLM
ncbi:MAG: ATP-binding protein [Candidatus Magasanikbacteria bacterium]|nr:ATP-binding protein [Candidatus Magasanikbacteria bacterium]